jgi:hypothetical protein
MASKLQVMSDNIFSKSVVKGLLKKGLTLIGAARVAKTSEARILAIQNGKASFTNGQFRAIEDAIGLSTGQIAMSTIKPSKGLAEIINASARLQRSLQKSNRRPKRAVA